MEVANILRDEGLQKWIFLGASIAVLEYIGEESLTNAYNRCLTHSIGRYVALGGLAVTGAHLLGVMPREIDPYYFIQDKLEAWKEK